MYESMFHVLTLVNMCFVWSWNENPHSPTRTCCLSLNKTLKCLAQCKRREKIKPFRWITGSKIYARNFFSKYAYVQLARIGYMYPPSTLKFKCGDVLKISLCRSPVVGKAQYSDLFLMLHDIRWKDENYFPPNFSPDPSNALSIDSPFPAIMNARRWYTLLPDRIFYQPES